MALMSRPDTQETAVFDEQVAASPVVDEHVADLTDVLPSLSSTFGPRMSSSGILIRHAVLGESC